MQRDQGLNRLFTCSWLYSGFQGAVGGGAAKRWTVARCLRPAGKEKFIDVGCGPGTLLDYLPAGIEYLGYDISEAYIRTAQARYGSRGTFLMGRTSDFRGDPRWQNADLVSCNGLLHHLDDAEVIEVLEFARWALKPGGRLVAIEPCFLLHQSRFSSWLMRQDRGANVRFEADWKRLVQPIFPLAQTFILTGLIRIPYIHICLECQQPLGPKAPTPATA